MSIHIKEKRRSNETLKKTIKHYNDSSIIDVGSDSIICADLLHSPENGN